MIVLNVFFSVNPDQVEPFQTLMTHLVEQSQQEQGNLRYQLAQDVLNPLQYTLIEHWKNQEAIDFHNTTPHFVQFLDKIQGYVTEPVEILQYSSS